MGGGGGVAMRKFRPIPQFSDFYSMSLLFSRLTCSTVLWKYDKHFVSAWHSVPGKRGFWVKASGPNKLMVNQSSHLRTVVRI